MFSCCTFVKNAIHLDFHLEAWIDQHCPMFAQVLIAETGSTDGTFELLKRKTQQYDNLKIVQAEIEDDGTNKWYRDCKQLAIDYAKYDNIIFLDCDEFIHEQFTPRFEAYDKYFQHTPSAFGMLFYNQFVKDYKTEVLGYEYPYQYRIFNKGYPYVISDDGANFVNSKGPVLDRPMIYCCHYGQVRHYNLFVEKQTTQAKRAGSKWNPMGWDMMLRKGVVVKWESGFPRVVRENPAEFTR